MSTLAAPLVTRTDAFLVRLNPVSKLAAAFVLMAGLLLSADVVTPALVLLVELAVVAVGGIPWGRLLMRTWPLLLGVVGLGISTLLFTSDRSGSVLFSLGSLDVTTGSALAALAISLRVLAISLPGILAFATTDPTEFADSLVEHLHTPPRFTFGALAAFRLFPLLGDEWRTMMLARRARGIDAGWNPVEHVRLFFSGVFGLLVAAIRRAVRLATAMDARGFGTRPDRTLARPKPFRFVDWGFIAAAIVVMVGAIAVSVALGYWHFLWL